MVSEGGSTRLFKMNGNNDDRNVDTDFEDKERWDEFKEYIKDSITENSFIARECLISSVNKVATIMSKFNLPIPDGVPNANEFYRIASFSHPITGMIATKIFEEVKSDLRDASSSLGDDEGGEDEEEGKTIGIDSGKKG